MKSNYEYDIERHGEICEQDLIVCPYCGYEHELHSDYFEDSDEYENEDYECFECYRHFKVNAEIRYEYWATTKK